MVIDTNIFIEHLRAKDKSTTTFFRLLSSSESLYVSVITAFELYAGADNVRKISDVDILLSGLVVLTITEDIAKKAGSLYITLRRVSKLIGERDILIAATAIVHGLSLKTTNKKHFERIADLKLV